MKKITEITNEREFISKLRTYYRKARRKGYQRDEISFLRLMEYIGSATSEFEYQSEKYFSVGIRAYDWGHGNSLLSALIDKWENEIEAEKRKKQPATPAETPQISTETAEVMVSAEGDNTAETQKNKLITYAGMEAYNVEYYVRRFGTVANLDKEYETSMDAIRCEKDEYDFNRRKGGKFRTERIAELNRKLNALGLEWMQIRRAMSEYFKEHATTSIQPPQSPEAPPTAECAAEPCKLAQTA